VLESWGFVEEICDAVGEQADRDRRWKHEAGLADVLIASLMLADDLQASRPRAPAAEGNNIFLTVRMSAEDCAAILAEAGKQIILVHDALAA
jgi:hypothetical protein